MSIDELIQMFEEYMDLPWWDREDAVEKEFLERLVEAYELD